jgi:phosphopantothenoylcysteine decarboxylase/phosphopantothenate--cysteine ligase
MDRPRPEGFDRPVMKEGKAKASPLAGKTVVLGVGGGIAAYKACEVVRLLVRAKAEVRVAMTRAATRFVGPLTLQALSGHPVSVEILDPSEDQAYGHLALARAADAFVVAPATADLMARLRAGMGDDAVTAAALAMTAPRLLAPAMNTRMWNNPATQENLRTLVARGYETVGPDAGELADGDVGPGRLAAPEAIVQATERLFAPRDLAGKKVVVTAGPTREAIDPVRFVSNPSTGKMGYAVARAAARRGARVVLVSGPTDLADPPGVETVRVTSAEQMAAAVEAVVGGAAMVFCVAAVSDYRPRKVAGQKLKKREGDETLELARTPDILATLGARFAGKKKRPLLVGFAAETENLLANAREKLVKKSCDLVVANDVTEEGAGFGADTNRVELVSAKDVHEVAGTKDAVAAAILDRAVALLSR